MPYIGKKPADIIATVIDTTTGTFSGEVDAGSLDVSGNADIDGTTNLDNTDIDGTLNVQGETTLQTHLNMGDSDIIKLGDSADLQIYHDGSHSYIDEQGTGNIKYRAASRHQFENTDSSKIYMQLVGDTVGQEFVQLRYNNATKLATTNTGIDVTGVITTDGMTTSADINFGDNDKAVFGAGSDLQIYHDGSSSYIDDTGTGVLYIRGDASVRIGKAGTTEVGLRVESDSYTKLYYDNAEKLSTTSSGIDVTGTTFNLDGGGSNPALNVKNSATYFSTLTHDTLNVQQNALKFSINGSEAMRINSSGNLGIGTSSPEGRLTLGVNTTSSDGLYINNSASGGGELDLVSLGTSYNAHGAGAGEVWFYSPDNINIGGATGNSNSIKFLGGGAERMRITSAGAVGIGTSSPSALLQVEGSDGVAGGAIMYTATSVASGYMSADAAGLCLATDTAGITFRTGVTGTDPTDTGTERMRIDSSGNVMIGTTVTGNAGGITMLPNNAAGAGTIVFDRTSTSNMQCSTYRSNQDSIRNTFSKSGNINGSNLDNSKYGKRLSARR